MNPFENVTKVTPERSSSEGLRHGTPAPPTGGLFSGVQKVLPQEDYSRNDLQGLHMPVINDYLSIMVGDHALEMDDEQKVETYINRMRGYAAGNSVRAGRELVRLNELDESQLARVGEAYHVFNEMQGVFDKGVSLGERAEGLWDYGRAILLDPINLVSFGVGKAAAAGTTKAAVKVAQNSALKAFHASMKSGAGKAAANKAANDVLTASIIATGKQEASRIAARTTQRAATKTFTQRLSTTSALREIGATVAFDSAVAVGTELAYQQGMVLTGQQEDYSWANAGLAALGVLAVGGVATVAVGVGGRRTSNVLTAWDDPEKAGNVLKSFSRAVKEHGSWYQKVAGGKQVEDLDDMFWTKMILGDEELGLKGLSTILVEEGYYWQRRTPEDKVSSWIADIIMSADPQDAKTFVRDFQKATGIKMTEVSKMGLDDFAKTFTTKMSTSARLTGSAGVIARQGRGGLAKPIDEITLEDYTEYLFNFGLADDMPQFAQKLTEWGGKGISRFQNNTIRMIVSNPATTALNVMGWGMASTINSLSSISMAVLHGGTAGAKLLLGDVKGGQEAARVAEALAQAEWQKLLNLMDPLMTYDRYKALAGLRPEAMLPLTDVLPGGIEDINMLKRRGGFDPDQTLIGRTVGKAMDEVVEGAQYLTGVKAQDVWTKSQEMIYQLDKNLRLTFNKSLLELEADPKMASKLMATEEYAKVEAKAVYETMRAIFSKSYKGRGLVGEVAAVIEDARNIPGVGLLVPFGRFFNNTIATLSDVSGLSVIGRMMGFNKERSLQELGSRAAVGWAFMASLVDNELESMDSGLGLHESLNKRTAEVINHQYNFPYSMFKAGARLMAYAQDGQEPTVSEMEQINDMVMAWRRISQIWTEGGTEIPPELGAQIRKDVFGQLTRQLVDSTNDIGTLLDNLVTGRMAWDDVKEVLRKAPTQAVSGWTRALEPVNAIVGVARGTDFKLMDRRQGNELLNNSIRYIDQMVEVFLGKEFPEQRQMATGPTTQDLGKFVGTRSSGHLSATEKVLNVMGKPHYLLSKYSPNPQADNRYNKLFNSIIEGKAKELWNSEKFRNGSMEYREHEWRKVVTYANDNVKRMMESAVQKSGDRALMTSLRLSTAYGEPKIQAALKNLKIEQDFTELTPGQLQLLEAYLRTRTQWLDQK